MKDNKCEFRYCEGHDVKCRLTGLTLGDIMGYDEKLCNICHQTFIRELVRKLANVLVYSRPNNNKELLNYMYGKHTSTDAILHDCDFCRNAYTCKELDHDNDLSYMSCGTIAGNNLRFLFASGNKRPTQLLVEAMGSCGWHTVGVLSPTYFPFCGRYLFENYIKER